VAISENRQWAIVLEYGGTENERRVALCVDDDEAELIAHAPDDLTRTTNALRGVLEVHQPSTGHGEYDPYCVGCWEAGGYDAAPTHPCETVRAITEALQGEQ
jgi:hypothetical protein